MTNRIAFLLGLVIASGIAIDIWVFEAANLLFLARKFSDLLDWMAFWR
ncbi:hypothetical protein R5H30_02175 [Sulfitobacter sp. D35]|nr:hypothetical protein [Sulfitobacter sp. D35]MDW4496772.1 hypothetical protein [Sulfitobacter sp. D35]